MLQYLNDAQRYARAAYEFSPGSYTYHSLNEITKAKEAFEAGEAYSDLGFPPGVPREVK